MKNPFKTLNVVLNFMGSLLIVLGFIMLIPIIIVLIYGEFKTGYTTLFSFLAASSLALLLGWIFLRFFKSGSTNPVQAIFICSLGWIIVSAVGAIPFVIAIKSNYLNAYFETMSGFTTTGITMFSGLDSMPKSILFWRSLTQWVGGLGILTFFIAVMSHAGGAHKLFGAESHKIQTHRPVPGLKNTVKILWAIYIIYTLFIFINLTIAGSSVFDSVCHSFTVLSTGGFSPYDASIAHYQQIGHPHYIWIEYIFILGMLLGGTNFLIHFRVLRGDFKALHDNLEIRYWFGFIGLFVGLILLERFLNLIPHHELTKNFWKTLEMNFRNTLFQVSAIITTTGFGTVDIGSRFFGHMAKQLFLIMMVIGGCVGSTGGGFKVLRIGILIKLIKREIQRVFTPRKGVSQVVIDKKIIDKDEIYRVSALFFMWIGLLVFGGLVTALLSHHDSYSSFSGMFSALGNIGPCYIPVNEMVLLHPIIKIVYIFGMLAGRLEILPVLLLFSRKAWIY
ncbi:MAG: TrkH family potassium uptake protein [Candidatus Cloacimonetes bacterium]|nr:TrkH family potassium uptake protein [Candidatus Cloacimonadota bacterium]MCF7815163.1 TrkH family potassium uptake protein [Candidatus Cloacimonadota bacterium]MCF7869379.1 TrkH family potassium uptake protein [Candidatus Cloacimonadota bacterium]MCF7884781.1 TrkH family potassium uptake protein [Candidatus Cloacimonadota bacterium]